MATNKPKASKTLDPYYIIGYVTTPKPEHTPYRDMYARDGSVLAQSSHLRFDHIEDARKRCGRHLRANPEAVMVIYKAVEQVELPCEALDITKFR